MFSQGRFTSYSNSIFVSLFSHFLYSSRKNISDLRLIVIDNNFSGTEFMLYDGIKYQINVVILGEVQQGWAYYDNRHIDSADMD